MLLLLLLKELATELILISGVVFLLLRNTSFGKVGDETELEEAEDRIISTSSSSSEHLVASGMCKVAEEVAIPVSRKHTPDIMYHTKRPFNREARLFYVWLRHSCLNDLLIVTGISLLMSHRGSH